MSYVRTRGLGSLTPIQQQIVNQANTIGLDPALALAVARQESAFKPTAVSSAGAIGLFQLMPATAASLGVDPNDPSQNIQGGEKYLQQLLAQYGGDVSKALWAYNAGPGNVAKGRLPAETANYIPAVLGYQAEYASSGDFSPSDVPADTSGDSGSSDGSWVWLLAVGLAFVWVASD